MAETMMAIARTRGGSRAERRPRPVPGAGDVRLRVLLAGICRTDLYAADGALGVAEGTVLGHELVGEVIEGAERGARVTVSPWIDCAACASCAAGRTCGKPRVLGVDVDGAFAEELVVPSACVHAVPSDWPLRRAAYVEPIAASMAVLTAPITREQRGAIAGEGRIAMLTLRILQKRGFDVRRVAAGEQDCTFDYAIETGGASLADALSLVRPRGVVVLKSRPPSPVSLDLATAVKKELTLSAVAYAPFADAIALAPSLELDDLLGDVYPLSRFEAAFARAREPLAPKVFLDPLGER